MQRADALRVIDRRYDLLARKAAQAGGGTGAARPLSGALWRRSKKRCATAHILRVVLTGEGLCNKRCATFEAQCVTQALSGSGDLSLHRPMPHLSSFHPRIPRHRLQSRHHTIIHVLTLLHAYRELFYTGHLLYLMIPMAHRWS